MLDGGHDHRHWCWTSQPPAAPPPQSCREQKFNCTSTHSSKHHALPRRGEEGEEGKRTVVAAVPPRASHFDLDLHTALQHGQFRGGNISHEQAMVSRDTAPSVTLTSGFDLLDVCVGGGGGLVGGGA